MKKKVTKGLSAALAAVMLFSMAGCGNEAATETKAETKTEVAEASTKTTTEEAAEAPAEAAGPAEISFMAPSFYGTDLNNEHSDEVIQKYEEYTGVKVNWKFEANDTYEEKLGLTLMDKDNMPMVIAISGSAMPANIIDAAKRGAFWDLTEYLTDAESYPNLAQSNPDVSSAFQVDGQQIGIYRARALGRFGFAYRTDWAENLGLEAPKTVEDVYNMMYAFTYDDPDGNGADDTYGLEMTKYTGPWNIIQTWFGCGNEWVEKDGKLVPVHQTAEYREALAWIRKIYEDGLIRQDWPTVDSATFSDAVKKGEAGTFCDVMDGSKRIWNYFTDNSVMSVTDPSVTATMTMVGAVNGKTLATAGQNGCYVITKAGAKTEEDVKNCLRFLDKMNDNDMRILADYGMEGVTFDLDDKGEIVVRSDLELGQLPQCGLNQSVAYIPEMTSTEPALSRRDSEVAMMAAQEANAKVAVTNPAIGYLANSEANAEFGTDIAQIIDDARTQYICGQIDEAGLDEAAKQWSERGGQQVIDEINAMYQSGK